MGSSKSAVMHRDDFVERTPFFYGWVVWGVATFGLIATMPGQSVSVSLFFDDLIADFNLSRSEISLYYLIGTFTASLSLTYVGRLVDRYGNRRMSVIISALFAVVLVLWSLVAGPLAILLGFIAIRGLGQGALSIASTTAVPMWFKRRRGLMTSLTLVGFAALQGIYANGVRALLETYDWRQVWIILGIAVGVSVPPIMWLLMRDKPEDYGLLPDGERVPPRTDDALAVDAASEPDEDNWTLREAMQTPIFWIFIAGQFMPAAWGTGLIIHQISIFESQGYTAATATEIFALAALLNAGASLLSGVLIDRVRPGLVLAFQLATVIAVLFIAMNMSAPWVLPVYAIFFGLAMGAGAAFAGTAYPNLFGRRSLGSIRGFATTAMVAGTSTGPFVYGLSFDLTGSYDVGFVVAMIVTAVPMILSMIVTTPRRRLPIGA